MRIKRLSQMLEGVDGYLIENPVDLFYLTGLNLSRGRLWVTPNGSTLFVDGRYYDSAKKSAPCPVQPWEEFKNALSSSHRISFDSAYLSYQDFLNFQKSFPKIQWIPTPQLTKQMRVCKDREEITALKKAAHLTAAGIQHIIQHLKVGVTELELAREFEIFCLKQGGSGLSFEPIIAFGENSAYPHYRAGLAKLKKDQIVLIDVGAIVDNYRGDMTRVHFFGKVDPELIRFEKIVSRAQKTAIDHVRPGIEIGELDRELQDHFEKDHVKQLYIHSLGHGIGLETHEFPRIKADGEDRSLILKPGMVFTIEPGLYRPGLGGVRIEDMILVTENGHEVIT